VSPSLLISPQRVGARELKEGCVSLFDSPCHPVDVPPATIRAEISCQRRSCYTVAWINGGIMGMKIECLVCLKETAIPKNLNTQKYDGQITCRECGSLLQVKLVKSKVEQCKVVREGHPKVSPDEAL